MGKLQPCTPGELNLYLLAKKQDNPDLSADEITRDYLTASFGSKGYPLVRAAYDSAFPFIMSVFYTLGNHTADHSRLNFHRPTIYSTHTTGEWYPPDQQMRFVGHNVNRWFHNYKDIINVLSFPVYKTDTAAMQKDLKWVLDSGWLNSNEMMSWEYLRYIIAEKDYGVQLAEGMLRNMIHASELINHPHQTDDLIHVFRRSLIVAKERRGAAKAIYGYRLWCKGKAFQTIELKKLILQGLDETEQMLDSIDQYPLNVPLGHWRWKRDRESFDIYKKAITQLGWKELKLFGIVGKE